MEHVQTVEVAVIGGGPAGLMAAEVLLEQGHKVHLYDGMPVVARKLVVAGQTNLGLTRDQPLEEFLHCYGDRAENLRSAIEAFSPIDIRSWAHDLDVETFVGTSSQVFPRGMTAATLLDNWLSRLEAHGLVIHCNHLWQGWRDGDLLLSCLGQEKRVSARAVLLALGGGSWPQLGSTGSWVSLLRDQGINIVDLQPANCGFDCHFTPIFTEKFIGQPVKNVVLTVDMDGKEQFSRRGELMVTANGFEGGLLYWCVPHLRKMIATEGKARVYLDLCPDLSLEQLCDKLKHPRGKRSLASHLRKTVGIDGVKGGLLHEFGAREQFGDSSSLARWLKTLPVPLTGPRPLAEALSSSGGVSFEELDDTYMFNRLPGVFCAGEMVDWEAPTGGYLLTACLATGRAAGRGAAAWLKK